MHQAAAVGGLCHSLAFVSPNGNGDAEVTCRQDYRITYMQAS
jgi:hypothetical protein